MKKCLMFMAMFMGLAPAYAQSSEVQQLILDVEKLSQFKQILQQMKTGYEVLDKGYSAVRDISKGNFNLHKAFLDRLMAVSPTVRNYKKVADIARMQLLLSNEYKSAWKRFAASGSFNAGEMSYMGRVYGNLLDQSLKNIDDLVTVLTDGVLRMGDDERLSEIDRIHEDTKDKLLFLRRFNSDVSLLQLQRARAAHEVGTTQKMYGWP